MNEIFCSCIITTVGRESLNRTVRSVLTQQFPQESFEIIVVNDSGEPLNQENWGYSNKIHMIHTNRRERSVARNAGASIAKGAYLHFLDDDDWLDQYAYKHLWELSQTTNAKWLYGMTQLVDRKENPLLIIQHNLEGMCFVQAMAGEWIPLQSSLIEQKAFWNAGGFNPLLSGPEDIDLQRRVFLNGNIAETQNIISYVARGEEGSTTNYAEHSKQSRWAREIILDSQKTFTAMHRSATNSSWRGYLVRIYLTSVVWNLREQRLFTAINRLFSGFASMMVFLKDWFVPAFWQSILKPYQSITFEKGIIKAKQLT